MVSSVRYRDVGNTTGAVIAVGGAVIDYGKDYALETVSRTLDAIDVGNAAGKTQHANGMIFAEFRGAEIKQVVSAVVLRTDAGFKYEFLGVDIDATHTVLANFGFSITNSAGVSTLRLKDDASLLNAFLAAGDEVVVTLAIGNS